MSLRWWIRLTTAITVLVAMLAIGVSWRAEMRYRTELATELAATKQALAAADARQQERDTRLAATLAEIAAAKRAVKSPAQIIRELPKVIALPAPITLDSAPRSDGRATTAGIPSADSNVLSTAPNVVGTSKGQATIAAEDLKPLYDFALDCKACQANLAASQSDLADERNKTAALAKERDSALRVARGGSVWQRIGRASKWLLVGAAAGAVASRAVH